MLESSISSAYTEKNYHYVDIGPHSQYWSTFCFEGLFSVKGVYLVYSVYMKFILLSWNDINEYACSLLSVDFLLETLNLKVLFPASTCPYGA